MAVYIKNDNELGRTEPTGREAFAYDYLPEQPQRLLREAFGCYTADLFLAFGILTRQTIAVAEAAQTARGPSFGMLFDDAAAAGDVDEHTRAALREVLFGTLPAPEITADQAAVLIELVKDMFQQRYVRRAKLRRAIKVRRHFARGQGLTRPLV